ncbi:hypothetical protein EV102420_10_02070 [Pseudescherichia vulneris NBRC 102420]|uniref:Nitric oxide reductase n=1 Tax=Pseudescherichia vulneris NBRC 102420 TaxID=1115515 RepID=A0A090V0U3_PSEVU|nr:hypothetical protein [Pseudescherichia vulneris]GAL58426.1 hypothetical protein EV102420_10_02070 [Pseudescherichia vulneris NBRC 102420]STQ60508.1 Uncharacterised protein [Pseudescherichia vulneris]
MKLDAQLPFVTALLFILSVLFPFFPEIPLPVSEARLVNWIENGQALWLLFGALFTLFWIKPWTLTPGQKAFWLWSVAWWVVLLGRSTSWGRVYFPDEPRVIFRIISVVLIAALVLPVIVSATLRKEIALRFRQETFPLWTVLLVVITFLLSDAVEHHRLLGSLVLHDAHDQDLLEELYEIPFMLGLFIIAFGMMQRDKVVGMRLSTAH